MTRLVYVLLVSITALLVFTFLDYSQKYWLVSSAFLFSLIFRGDSFFERLIILSLTGLIAAAVIFVAGFIPVFSLEAIYLCVVTICLLLFSQRYPNYLISTLFINVFVIIAVCTSVSLSENIARAVFILCGTAIVMIAQCIFQYHFKRNAITSWLIISLQQLKWLSVEIFACYTQEEYVDNLYLFERRLHLQKIKVMQSLNNFHAAVRCLDRASRQAEDILKKPIAHQQLNEQLQMLSQIYDLMLSLAKLRWRVTDFTIFRVCDNEMRGIENALNQIFLMLARKIKNQRIQVESYPLAQAINRFEETYQHVIQVTAREPLVFLLFINDLKELNTYLHDFST